MPEDLSTKSCLVVDNGLFSELAPRLAESFGQTLYFMPWASAYPAQAPAVVGAGLPGVERVPTFWDRVPDVDVVVFPDLYFAAEQQVVADRFGKPVFGHRAAEALELDRRGARRLQKGLGIPAPRTRFFTGVDDLADHLRKTPGPLFVKISCYRGDAETWRHDSWHVSEIYLDHFTNKVGALADRYEFMVEEEVPGVEIGYDGWTVKGEFPAAAFWGIEIKDRGYAGHFRPYAEHPGQIKDINGAMAPVLKREGATGFCSFECRVGPDGVPRMIDPCLRCCSPPFEATMEAYANLAEIVWEGAWGRMAEPRALGEYVAVVMMHSQFALTNWVPLDVPADDRRWVKVRNAAVLGKKLYHVPVGGSMPEIGAVVAVADTFEEAAAQVRERAARVKAYNLDVPVDALDQAQEEITRAADYGITF